MIFQNMDIKHKGLIETIEKKTLSQGSFVECIPQTMYLGVCTDDKFTNHISNALDNLY